MTNQLVQFADHGKMTEAEYRQRREAIRATYGDTEDEREGLFDQQLAMLMAQSKWDQEQIAREEQKTHQWVSQRQLFGHFLTDATMVALPKNLTERKFRGYWNSTDKHAHITVRFAAVRQFIEENSRVAKPPVHKTAVAKAILANFADGEWHRLATIVEQTQCAEEDVNAVLKGMLQEGTHDTFCEKRKGGTSYSYRIVRGRGRKVDAEILLHEVQPIIRALETEGRKHIAKASPATIAKLANDLRTVIERLAHQALRPARRSTAAEGE